MARTTEIDEIQSVRDALANRWAPWARQITLPQGWRGESIEYVMMRFGGSAPRAQGAPAADYDPQAEKIEATIVSMPAPLKPFIVTEFCTRKDNGDRLTRDEKAKLCHVSYPRYYAELRSALWWLHSAGVC